MTGKILKFYISSTFKDLKEERKLLAEYLTKNLQLPIRTELASSDPVLERCLADVEACDTMILLVASSYGTIVEGPDGERLSITHREFLHATKKGKPVLAFELTYVPAPSPPLTAEEEEGLRTLKGQIRDLRRISARVSTSICYGFEVLSAVRQHIESRQKADLSPGAEAGGLQLDPPLLQPSPPTPTPSPSRSTEIYLHIQVLPRGPRFHLIPEVFVPRPDGGGWESWPEADPEPREGVAPGGLPASLEELCIEAQAALPLAVAQAIDQVVMELFLPTEVLAACLSGQASMARLRQALNALSLLPYPYVIRSLERAENGRRAPVRVNQLRTQWGLASSPGARLLACARWPEASVEGDPAHGLRPFRACLQSQRDATALLGLADCPADRLHTGQLLQGILASPLPVVLLWHADGGDPPERWAQTAELLNRPLPALPLEALDPPAAGPPLPLPLPPGPWCSRAAAERRPQLLGGGRMWVDQAVLLIDCPERWPTRLTAPQASEATRLRLRRRATP
jgi:hypothetical protein